MTVRQLSFSFLPLLTAPGGNTLHQRGDLQELKVYVWITEESSWRSLEMEFEEFRTTLLQEQRNDAGPKARSPFLPQTSQHNSLVLRREWGNGSL